MTRSIRFSILNKSNKRGATWKCSTPIGVGKHDIYLMCRELKGSIKASLHQSGDWRIAYSRKFFEENIGNSQNPSKRRVVDQWPKPKEISPGVTLAFRIITPSSAVNLPFNLDNFSKIKWIPSASSEKAIEIAIVITSASANVLGWPGKKSIHTTLLDSMELESREKVWIVYRTIDIPNLNLSNRKITPDFYKGKSKNNLKSDGLRTIIFANMNDGSRVMLDCIVNSQIEGHNTN